MTTAEKKLTELEYLLQEIKEINRYCKDLRAEFDLLAADQKAIKQATDVTKISLYSTYYDVVP